MLVYLNNRLVPEQEARVSVFDRGFLLGDAIYEGLRSTRGHIIAVRAHIERMRRGAREVGLSGFDPSAFEAVSRQLLDANRLRDAFIYWQVTRGAPLPGQPWRQRVPSPGPPTTFAYAAPLPALPEASSNPTPATRTAAVLTDKRWLLGHIKATSLLGGVVAAIEADREGFEDAILVRDGLVAESVAANVMIVRDGRVATPALDSAPILAGVTRDLLVRADRSIEERSIAEAELQAADEILLVGTTTLVTSITRLGDRVVGDGRPGPVGRRLLRTLLETIEQERDASARPAPAAAAGVGARVH